MEANGIDNPHILWIGQKIHIPGVEKEAAPKKPKAKKAE
jgi:nucleoid-associated protein YgaU